MKLRPYVFEIILAVNTAWVFWTARGDAVATMKESALNAGLNPLYATLLGIFLRFVIASFRGHGRRYLQIISNPRWWTDTIRLLVAMIFLAETYGWIKLLVPVLHPVLYDAALYRLDQAIFFGMSPPIFFLQLFSNSGFLRFIDQAYPNFFIAGMLFALAFFFSMPRRRVRITFLTSSTIMWLAGAWLYMLIPSLGPAFRFPDIWFPYVKGLPRTQWSQSMLMRNYHAVIRLAHGGPPEKLNLSYGVAAFPSLHVATQTQIAIWMRKWWRPGAIYFTLAAFIVFIGSMITGWHYLIDGIAGAALAFGSYAASQWIVKKEFRPSLARFSVHAADAGTDHAE
ncbi:MAG TPA: phosphatase PAP2 family protein [Thermoanaerobaculia bacterium]